jgi:hypothetical protein
MDVVDKIVREYGDGAIRDHLRVDHLVAVNPNLASPYGAEVFRHCRPSVDAGGCDRVKESDIVGVDFEGAATSPLFQRSFACRPTTGLLR